MRIRITQVAFWLLLSGAVATSLHAQPLWREGGENGLAYVVDGTASGYSLLQSDVVSEGDYAFHLAHPNAQSNWFEIDRDITPQADTQLFFQSRLSWATSDQVARVELSTNGGTTWPVELYAQGGTGDAGEGSFNLRQIDLGSYAGQSVRFRFNYDFDFGSYYNQSETSIGWRVDDIQFGAQFEKQLYSVGDPTAYEQQYLEYINRARADAIVEANRLAAETDPDVTNSYRNWGIDTQDIVGQFVWSVNTGRIDQVAQPLSFNENLLQAAQLHSQDMLDNQFQGHVSSANPPDPLPPYGDLGARVNAVGYQWVGLGENVFSNAKSVAHGHAGFDVDWGSSTNPSDPNYNPAFAGQGMQNPAGHRLSLHNDSFKEIGIGVINDTNGSVGPQLVTQDLGNPGDATFITGVVYEDLNGNNFYDIGEGRDGVRVDIDESAYYAVSTASGAYSIPVTGDGYYTVEFTGDGYQDYSFTALVNDGKNVKVDYLVTTQVFDAADYNQDGAVDSLDYDLWRSLHGSTTDLRADGNGDQVVDAADYTVWRDALASGAHAVPEPASVALLTVAVIPLFRRARQR